MEEWLRVPSGSVVETQTGHFFQELLAEATEQPFFRSATGVTEGPKAGDSAAVLQGPAVKKARPSRQARRWHKSGIS